MTDRSGRPPLLRLVGAAGEAASGSVEPTIRDTDWSILMARAQDGDRNAYQRLLQEMTPYLRVLAARRHREPGDIEDAVQDILLTVHAIRQTYDPNRPFGPWLVTIANRRLIDRLRRQGRRRSRETPLTPEHETFTEPQANLYERPDHHELEKAIGALPPMQRQAVELLKLKEMSLKEASTASGMSVASLKVNVHRAVKNLRKIFVDRSQS
ncbi:sigma-70 family RNA polymerase sigma factor [Bradyrhizobium sp. BR13661]|jgi:RNA polymerase sigma factor (sigma-70 family)|uniref:sigma-70 family RNA polymerase sigma factor n=1 Tax=Bradyrhizobium sp. BR13661 TaxID=2940622 RepID=UPI002473B3AA|nr:sigma-70 family RNA polymerase sigma factor [Bradyrhizobium sp. BR13661]MDH6260491.1 RNA polymerase sigma factor (sigma-70 family) [Bradyrhizobium sp. BR13661]